MRLEGQGDVSAAVFEIECDIPGTAKAAWDCCDLKQFCAKLDAINDAAKRGKLTTDPSVIQERNAARGERLFRQRWNEAPYAWQPIQHKFYHPCAFDRASQTDFQMSGQDWNPDHIHDLQFGGHPTDFKNFKWLSSSVNKSLGPSLSGYSPDTHPGGVSADCCPAEETHCADKADTDPVLA